MRIKKTTLGLSIVIYLIGHAANAMEWSEVDDVMGMDPQMSRHHIPVKELADAIMREHQFDASEVGEYGKVICAACKAFVYVPRLPKRHVDKFNELLRTACMLRLPRIDSARWKWIPNQ